MATGSGGVGGAGSTGGSPIDITAILGAGGAGGERSTGEVVGTAAGTAIGTAVGGPVGGAIGGAIGGMIGGMFGKKKKKGGDRTVVSIAAFPCPKVDDKGLNRAWFWADKIAQGVALWATYETYKAAKEDYKIAKRYHELAKEQWDLHREYYHPLEQQELDEIWAEKPYEPDYKTAVAGHTHTTDNVLNSLDKHRMALGKKYCICPDVSAFTKADFVSATISGDSDNFARRYAEKLAQERNDIRWSRRVAAAARGRGLLSESASHAQRASSSYSAYARAMGGLAGNAMEFSGYVQNRHQTTYNGDRERFNSRAMVFNVGRHTDVQSEVRNIDFTTKATGGISWGNSGSAYMQSGIDPTSYVSIGGSHR